MRKYIAAIYDDATSENLRNWCIRHGFDLNVDWDGNPADPADFEFHTTIFYQTNDVELPLDEMFSYPLIESSEVFPKQFGMLGKDNDIPVLKLECSGMLATLRKKYEDLGLTDSWDEYIPHISLSYAKQHADLQNIPLPDFKMTFSKVKVKDIKD